jgi:hypothetical protein
MDRRKFLLGMGSLAAGSAATIGSGAWGVEAVDRDAEGEIAADNNAYLSLVPVSPYSELGNTDAELDVRLGSLNSNSVTELDDIFLIQNNQPDQGALDVQIDEVDFPAGDVNVRDVFISSKSGGVPASVGVSLEGTARPLPVGGEIGVGVEVAVTSSLPLGATTTGTFHVDAM